VSRVLIDVLTLLWRARCDKSDESASDTTSPGYVRLLSDMGPLLRHDHAARFRGTVVALELLTKDTPRGLMLSIPPAVSYSKDVPFERVELTNPSCKHETSFREPSMPFCRDVHAQSSHGTERVLQRRLLCIGDTHTGHDCSGTTCTRTDPFSMINDQAD
jgi:hypothetical protein